jgi:hypothetical protein
VCKKIESDNVVLSTIFLEGVGQMTFITVQNKHPPNILSPFICILMEVFDLFQACIIVCPTICRSPDRPDGWKATVGIPRHKMMFVLDDQHWRYYKPVYTYIFDYNRLFSIANLKFLGSAFLFRARNNYTGSGNDVYHKAGFVEVIEIAILNAEFCAYILY